MPSSVKTFSDVHYRFLEGVLNICAMWKLQIVITLRFSDTKWSDSKGKRKRKGEREEKADWKHLPQRWNATLVLLQKILIFKSFSFKKKIQKYWDKYKLIYIKALKNSKRDGLKGLSTTYFDTINISQWNWILYRVVLELIETGIHIITNLSINNLFLSSPKHLYYKKLILEKGR